MPRSVRYDMLVLATCVSARLLTPLPAARRLRGGDDDRAEGMVSACLFDFDGTLADSEDLHRQTFGAVLGLEVPTDYWNKQCVGSSPRLVIAKLLELRPEAAREGETHDETVGRLLDERLALFQARISARELVSTPGAGRLLDELRAAGVRCACVSSGSSAYVTQGLRAMKLDAAIELVVAGDDEELDGRHKPDPHPYLLAARRLGVEPAECIAFEDSLSGIRSAQAAGMRVVVITSEATRSAPPAAIEPVHALISDFDAMPRARLGI